MNKPTPLKEVVQEYLKRQGFLPKVRVYQAVERFSEWFPELTPFCAPYKVQKGVLILEIENPLYISQVEGKAGEVIERFRREGIPLEGVKLRIRR
ncbi:MAG: DciA family protein [Candidatus Caldatribacteriaceae bacterium]